MYWKTVDTIPKDGRSILIYNAHGIYDIGYFYSGDNCAHGFYTEHGEPILDPKFWLELTDPYTHLKGWKKLPEPDI